MGMDVSGINPTSERGSYFRANLWGWRPIHYLCEMAIQKSKLNYDTSNWGWNDGGGLNTPTKARKLALAIESLLDEDQNMKSPDDKIYLCTGMWVLNGTGQFADKVNRLNEVYPAGTILYSPIVDSKGRMLEPAHSIDRAYLNEWIDFLKDCGGFEIY